MPDFCLLIAKVPGVGRHVSGRAILEEATRVRHQRKTSERFPEACSRITSGLPDNSGVDGTRRVCQY